VPGLKLIFIPSTVAATTDFDEIPFPNGKGQVKEKIIGFLRDLRDLCGKSF